MSHLLHGTVSPGMAELCHFTHFTLCQAEYKCSAANKANAEKEGKMIHSLSFKWYLRLAYGFTYSFFQYFTNFLNKEKFKEFYREHIDVYYLKPTTDMLL